MAMFFAGFSRVDPYAQATKAIGQGSWIVRRQRCSQLPNDVAFFLVF